MTEALGVPAAECAYLDDLGINCKPAAAMGMAAIKVASEEQALSEQEAVVRMRGKVWGDRGTRGNGGRRP